MTITFIIGLLVLCLVLYLVYWMVGQFGAPDPVQKIVGIILILVLLLYVLRGFGFGGGVW